MIRTKMFSMIALCTVIFVAGCGGGSTVDGCLKNPWLPGCSVDTGGGGTSIEGFVVSGRVQVPSTALSKPAGAARSAAAITGSGLSGATVALYTMDSEGDLTAVSGLSSATTDSNGDYSISGVSAGRFYVIQATGTAGSDTIKVRSVVTVTTANVSDADLDWVSSFTLAGVAKIVEAYNDASPPATKNLADFDSDYFDDLYTLIDTYLETDVTEADIVSALKNDNTLGTQFTALQTAESEIDDEVTDLSDPGVTDTTAPSAPATVYDGTDTNDDDTTTETTQLSANWTASTDAESGIDSYWYAIGTTSGGTDVLDYTTNGTSTTVTKTSLTLTVGTTYYISVKAKNGAGLFSSVTTSDGITVESSGDTTAPQISEFDPASGATNVAADGAAFSILFNESMDSTVDLNNQTTLTASGFTMQLQRSDTLGTLTFDTTNALSYGSFAWSTTNSTDDTLTFTLKSNATLLAAGLDILYAGKTYSISSIDFTTPSNLTDTSSNALDTITNVPTGGSFTVTTDSTQPQVLFYLPGHGNSYVTTSQPLFRVVFNETMNMNVNLNNQTTLNASGFSLTIQDQTTMGTLTINPTNALSYGDFMWLTTNVPYDTLGYQLKDNATLSGGGLKTLDADTQYMITERTVPTNLEDYSSNALNTTTGIPTQGWFRTAP